MLTQRALRVLVVLLLALAGTAASASAQTGSLRLRGDVDADDAVTAIDALAVLSSVVGIALPSGYRVGEYADTDGNGQVTAGDALIILAYSVGKDVSRYPINSRVVIIASVTVTPGTAAAFVGDTLRLTAVVRDEDTTVVTSKPVLWSTLDPERLEVSAEGLVTARAPGAGRVVAAAGGKADTVQLELSAPIGVGEAGTVAAGPGNHACALDASGAAYCWGRNDDGQLGDGTFRGSPTPVRVAGDLAFRQISAGAQHSCAITLAGAPYCWGRNQGGILGNAGANRSAVPIPVNGAFRFVQISVGRSHGCGLAASGIVHCWGFNGQGALGSGSTSVWESYPQQVATTARFSRISVGSAQSCGITPEGEAYCWGDNHSGQVGDGTTVYRGTPVRVSGGNRFARIDAGTGRTCAVTRDGDAYCWGLDLASVPSRVSATRPYAQISAGTGMAVCAVGTDGKGECFGRDPAGEFGDGGFDRWTSDPVPTTHTEPFQEVRVGESHVCAATAARKVWCWGNNQSGQLGRAEPGYAASPVSAGSQAFQQLGLGDTHSCALTPAGRAYCWGAGRNGQLGSSLPGRYQTSPVEVQGGHVFTQVGSARGLHVCAVRTDGQAFCWGNNFFGQLGQDSWSSPVPVAVRGGHSFKEVGTGKNFSCGLTVAGSAYCWGGNMYGELGDGTEMSGSTPVPVSGGHTFVQIAVSSFHACGLTAGGDTYCWGSATSGSWERYDVRDSRVPVRVPGEQKLVKISGGAHQNCGVDAAGAAFCWGNQNGDGSLGDGDLFFRPKSTPVRVLGGHTFRDVRAGHGVACGVTTQSEVYCWGKNLHGEAGVTSPSPVRAPERISGGAAFTQVDVGDSHACGISDAGTVCWGAQGFGQVGGGRIGYGFLPAPVAGPLGSLAQGLPSLGRTRAAPSPGAAPSAALRSEPLPRCLSTEQPGPSPAPGPGACTAEPGSR